MRVARAAMVVRLTEKAKKVNDAKLKIVERPRGCRRSSRVSPLGLVFVFLLTWLHCNRFYNFSPFFRGQG